MRFNIDCNASLWRSIFLRCLDGQCLFVAPSRTNNALRIVRYPSVSASQFTSVDCPIRLHPLEFLDRCHPPPPDGLTLWVALQGEVLGTAGRIRGRPVAVTLQQHFREPVDVQIVDGHARQDSRHDGHRGG